MEQKMSAGDPLQHGLTVEHQDVLVDEHSVGLAVSIGSSFLFYTTDADLQPLDGQRFESMDDLRSAVAELLEDSTGPDLAA